MVLITYFAYKDNRKIMKYHNTNQVFAKYYSCSVEQNNELEGVPPNSTTSTH